MPTPDFVVVRFKSGDMKEPFITDRVNLNDDLEEIGSPELQSGGPVLSHDFSSPKASTAKSGPDTGNSSKKEG